MKAVTTVVLSALLCSAALAAEQAFDAAPTAKKVGNEVTIAFTLKKAADVEVAVLDAKGKVVRHLAAGVLGGKNPPPAPLKMALAQSIVWDGKDDLGNPATGGPFSIRVRAGMSVKFGRVIGGSPYTGNVTSMPYRTGVNGVVLDGEGGLYVKMMSDIRSHGNTGLWPWQLRHFYKDGTYLKTLLPYPPSTDTKKANGFRLLKDADGHFTPALVTSLYPTFYVFGDQVHSRLIDGCVVFIDSMRKRLNFFKVDGSNAVRTMPMWSAKAKLKCPPWLNTEVAFSPDGKAAYYSNVAGSAYDGKKPEDIDPRWPQGRVYKHDLTTPGSDPVLFFGLQLPDWEQKKYWMPSAWDMKTAAAGIACDAKGNVLVGDLVNMEVVEISPAGKKLSATKVPWPDKVMVHRVTGDLYVLSKKVSRGFKPPATLLKITGRGAEAKVVARLPFKGRGMAGAYALDDSGDVPVLWFGGDGRLMRVEDRGSTFVIVRSDYINRDRNAINFVGYMDVDPHAELVYVMQNGVYRYNGETGEGGRLKMKAVDLAIGPSGMIYTWGTSGGYHGPIARYTRDLKPAPLAASGKHTFGKLSGRAGRGSVVCGIDVDARGNVYATDGSNQCKLLKFTPDGKLVGDLLPGVTGYGGAVRTDLAGNIYVVQRGLPKKFKRPAGFQTDAAYRRAVGSILKFGPQGGKAIKGKNAVLGYEGVLKVYPGCGPNSEWAAAGSCVCTKPRFDVDRYGRLFIPNAVTFSVSVRDNAGNEIVRFGHYGNFDAQGPESAEPKPEIPLGWPTCAGASDKYIYVGDTLNHRVVRVDKVWGAEQIVDVK